MQLRKYRLLNKQNHISSNFFVIISMVCICITKFQRMVLSSRVFSTFKISQYSKVDDILALFLTILLVFGQLKHICAPLWKSSMAKTRSAGLVLPPLSVTTISVYTTSYTLELLNVLHMDSYDMNDIQISNSKS